MHRQNRCELQLHVHSTYTPTSQHADDVCTQESIFMVVCGGSRGYCRRTTPTHLPLLPLLLLLPLGFAPSSSFEGRLAWRGWEGCLVRGFVLSLYRFFAVASPGQRVILTYCGVRMDFTRRANCPGNAE